MVTDLFSFFLFCSLRQKMIWTGQEPWETSPFSPTTTLDVYLSFRFVLDTILIEVCSNSLKDMSRNVLAGNGVLRDTLLVHAHLGTMSGR